MKDGTRNIIAACILAFGLIVSSIIFAYSNRYEIVKIPDGYMIKVDKWSGTMSKCVLKK